VKPSSPFSPEEEDAIAAEVAEDIAAGVGDKHFQEIADSIISTQGSAHVEMDHDVRDRLERFARAFHVGLNDRLRGNEHGFVCNSVKLDGHGQGFICRFRDKQMRPFEVECSYEDGFEAAARYGEGEMGRGMMAAVIERLVAARVKYFARMEKMH